MSPDESGTSLAAKSPTVAVIIPTKDRPELLGEAIASAAKQSHPPHEIIVVDDGSADPVDATSLQKHYGPTVRLIRNQQSLGLAYSRNRGAEEASADYVTHLDDDDLLAGEAIERCVATMADFPETELIFFSAEGFGSRAEHFNLVQPAGVKRVIALGRGVQLRSDIVSFNQDLFAALLHTVPIAFQRVFVSKAVWQTVTKLRWQVYCLDPTVPNEAAAKIKISGPLRDSEWARYAALTCQRMVLLDRPLYLQRCAGQGYSSLPSNLEAHMRQGLAILKQLLRGTESIPELGKRRTQIVDRLADAFFDAAYQQHQSGARADSLRLLREAMSHRIKLKQLRLMVRLALPRQTPAIN